MLGEDLVVGLTKIVDEEGGREPVFHLIVALVLVLVLDVLWACVLVFFVRYW